MYDCAMRILAGLTKRLRVALAPSFLSALAVGFPLVAGAGCEGSDTMMPGTPTEPEDPPAPAGFSGTLPTTGRPYKLLRGRGEGGGQLMTTKQLDAELADADAICLGEQHDSADAHEAQLAVLKRYATRAAAAQRRLATGLEMFQVPFQQPLDDYSAGRIDEATMLTRTEYPTRWGINFAFYRPLLEQTVAVKGSVRGLNARDETVRKINRTGLASLTPEERMELPDLDLTNAEHKAWFAAIVGAVHGGAMLDNLYAAQVARDETMAATAWQWLRDQDPAPRQIAIIAGNGHCISLAIPMRLLRRGAKKVISVRPMSENQADQQAAITEGYSDILLVIPNTPPQ
jgi:uncharacterized iron-regulated protein